MKLLLLLACADAPPPPAASPAGPRPGDLNVPAQIVDARPGVLRAITAQGETLLRLDPAVAPPPAGALAQLVCTQGDDGILTVRRASAQTGLPIWFGTITSLDEGSATIESSLGTKRFTRLPITETPEGVAVGSFVGAKYYDVHGEPTLLNLRPFPGVPEVSGVLRDAEPGSLRVATVKGVRRFPAPEGAALPAAGTAVRVRYAVNDDISLRVTGLEPVTELTFIGKLSDWDPSASVARFVDAWGGTLGIVSFAVPMALPTDLVPGDLAELAFTVDDQDRAVIARATERALSPIYFGAIQSIDDTSVRLVTLQRQEKLLRVTPDTLLPKPIRPGDMADVVWAADPAGGAPVALVIVKE